MYVCDFADGGSAGTDDCQEDHDRGVCQNIDRCRRNGY